MRRVSTDERVRKAIDDLLLSIHANVVCDPRSILRSEVACESVIRSHSASADVGGVMERGDAIAVE